MIGTALAARHGTLKFQGNNVFQRKHGGFHPLFIVFPGDQCRAESAHDPGDIRADCLTAGHSLKTTQYGVVVKSASLNYDVFAQIFWIGELNHL